MQLLAVEAQPGGAVEEDAQRRDHGRDLLAPRLVAGAAVPALAARRHPAQHHVVADSEGGDAFAELGDDPGALMAHDQGSGRIPLAALDVQVGVADAGSGDAHAHLTGAGRGEVDVDELDGRLGSRKTTAFMTSFGKWGCARC